MITLADFKDILLSKAGGMPLSKVANFYALCYQAMNKVKGKVDLPSSMRTVQLTNPVYTDITLYSLPSDLVLNGIVNLRPITPDNSYYDFKSINQRQVGIETKYNEGGLAGSFTAKRYGVRNINGVQYLKLNADTTYPITIQSCDSLTASGSVAVIGTASDLNLDALQKVSSGASFSFTVGAGASNGIGGTLLTAVDLTNQLDFLAYVYIPSLTNVTGMKLKLGLSNASYYESSVATDFFGNALHLGWNLLRLPKSGFTVGAGTPNWANTLYWELDVLGTIVTPTIGFKVDSIIANIGALYEIDYYASSQFQTLAGAWISKPSLDTDKLILTEDELDLFTDQFIELMTVDLKQQGVAVDFQEYGGARLIAHYDDFMFRYPSMRQLVTTQYGNNPQGRINE